MKNRIRNLFIVSLLVCSCNYKSDEYETATEGELVGDLKHVQYWDYNDSWDLSSLDLLVMFEDGSSQVLKPTDKRCVYNFEPSSPVGCSHDLESFEVIDSYFETKSGKKINIKNRRFDGITIVNYPYKKRDTKDKIIFISICVLSLTMLFLTFYLLNRKKQKLINNNN